MRNGFAGAYVASSAMALAVLLLTACGPKNTADNDILQVPTVRQISTRLVNATVGRLHLPSSEAGEKWLLPTPTPVDTGLFDKVFGKPRALETPANPAQEAQSALGIVLAASLNVRSGPGLEHAVIATVSAGDRLPVVEQTGSWVRFKLPDGRTGWSAQEYVAIDGDVQTVAASPSVGAKAVVLADMLNVRERPDLAGNVIAALGRQECVDILGQQDGWVRVSLPAAKSGWCFGQYVQEVAVCPTPAAPNPHAVGGASAAQSAPASAPTLAAQQPLKPNASVVMSTNLHECFGGGWDELRYVRAGTPVQVLGAGPFAPPGNHAAEMGPGPYVKIRLWDGQFAWIAAKAVGVDAASIAQISGQCEPGDRIDWSAITPPTPRPVVTRVTAASSLPTATPRPAATPRYTHQKRDE